jgi:serine protease inhibitor
MSATGIKARGQAGSDAGQPRLVSANLDFGFRLLKELSAEKPQANIFISPYSIASVLQMVGTGARGQTQQELRQVLGTAGLGTDEVNAAYQQLTHSLLSQTNAILTIANALWYRQGAQLKPEFVEVNQQFYGARLSALDFSDPKSAQVMNHWAAEQTHGKIPTIISPPIAPDTAMVLANAIYFKGTWLNQFDPKQTQARAFHLLAGTEQPVPMMRQTRSFLYQEGEGLQAVQLPYAGRELVMQILLPETNSSLQALVGRMDSDFWEKSFLPRFQQRKGTLVFPRFTLRYGADLKAPLSALGVKSALSGGADFSGMSSSQLFLSDIKHQSFVEVNEQGTEAAAVTTGVMALASFRNQPPPFEMVVDRPFLFLITDQRTKCIVFAGLVFAPG